MIERVLDRVLLPFAASWVTSPTVERVFQSEVEAGVTGAESRGAMRQVPQAGVSWSILPTTTEQRSRIDEILRTALREGQAATPFWGRGLLVASGSSGTTVELDPSVPDAWVPGVGAVLWIPRESDGPFAEDYETVTVESVTGHTLTTTETLAADVPEGSLVWPVISGRFTGGEYEAVHGAVGVFKFSVRANHTREAMPYSRSVSPDPSDLEIPDPYSPPPTAWPPLPVVSRVRLLDGNALSLVYQVQVESEASSPEMAAAVWEWADYTPGVDVLTWGTSGAFGVPVQESSDTTLWRVPMRYRQAYYLRVTITTDGADRTSVPILIPGLYPERMMRVLQERREDLGGAAFTWPYSAPSYPPDGWYDSTIASLGNTAHATILSALRTAIRTTGFLGGFLNPWSGAVSFGRYTPRSSAFGSTWLLTPGSGFTPPAYEPTISETSLSTAITTSNWSSWWDDIARICLWAYKRFYRNSATQSPGELLDSKLGSALQTSGDMKPGILSSGGLGEQAQDAFDLSSGITGSVPEVRTTVTPASVDTYPWVQVYNAPGSVTLKYILGHWSATLLDGDVILPGEISTYRAAYYTGYSLSQIGVVGQSGVTPYYSNAGLSGIFYSGSGFPVNVPAQASTNPGLTAHTQFSLLGTIPYEGEAGTVYDLEVGSGLSSDAVNFLWLDVFNTTSRPLRNLGVEMVCYSVWYRSPIPEDGHWTHTIHESSTP